tara:strand:- start:1329 stop:1577 length:249 start_codon:yes stop_codon:yes gene_type:complete
MSTITERLAEYRKLHDIIVHYPFKIGVIREINEKTKCGLIRELVAGLKGTNSYNMIDRFFWIKDIKEESLQIGEIVVAVNEP